MKLVNFIVLLALIILVFSSCDNDDDNPVVTIELRDLEEVRDENQEEIENFLNTHSYRFEDNPLSPNFKTIVFDTIMEENSMQTPIIESPLLQSRQITQRDVEYTVYYLLEREGNLEERKPTFADSTMLAYQGLTIKKETFDLNPGPVWLDLTQQVKGFYEFLTELRGASGFSENSDGTINFNNDFGTGVVFLPSGLGYFAAPPANSLIETYQPIIFSVQLYKSKLTDHDNDGIPSYLEDLNNNRRVDDRQNEDDLGDDTDGDTIPNYLDVNDDGDSELTADEILVNEDGSIEFPDSNANGTPDYLDSTYPDEEEGS